MRASVSIEEAKVLFALLDAAKAQGLCRGTSVETRWDEARNRLLRTGCEEEGGLMWDLLAELEDMGVLTGWIFERWREIKKQSGRLAESASRHTPPFFASRFRE